MANVGEVKLRVGASVDQTERAVTGMRAVADQIEAALALLRLTATGTVHPSLVDAISRLEQAKARMDEAQVLARGAMDAARAYHSLA